MELQPLVSDAGLWSVLPPLLAIVLAIATREVIFSLFLGICAGLGIYAAQAPLPAQDLPYALVVGVASFVGYVVAGMTRALPGALSAGDALAVSCALLAAALVMLPRMFPASASADNLAK